MILPRPTPSRSPDRTVFFKHPFISLLYRLVLGAIFGWVCASYFGGHRIFPVRALRDMSKVYGDAFPEFLIKGDCGIDIDILKSMVGFGGGGESRGKECHRRKDLLGSVNDGDSRGCQLPYYPTERICIILERFPTILFVGDEVARSLYTTFNILLREDLEYGGLRTWEMNEEEKKKCSCGEQFSNLSTCEKFRVEEVDAVTKWSSNREKRGGFMCSKTPQTHIPSLTAPLTPETIEKFKNLTSNSQNPWQPTPLLLSLPANLTLEETTTALEEWTSLAREAWRNIPILYLPPPSAKYGKGEERWQYEREVKVLARRLGFEILNFVGLSGGREGQTNGVMRRELQRAMVVIGWLTFLESS